MLTDLFAASVRGAHYASVVSLFGCFAFLLAVARPAWRAVGGAAEGARRLERFLLPLVAWSLALTLVSGFLWLWVVTAGMSGRRLGAALSAELIGTVLTATGFGRLWQLRFAVAVVLAGFLLFCHLTGRHSRWLFFGSVGGLLSGVLLASLALAGHGADDSGTAGIWHLGADLLHLLAAGAWLGSLPPLVFVLWQAREPGASAPLRVAQAATTRFSTLGLLTVATLIATGIVNTWYLVGSVPSLVGTPYGRVLLIKLALFAGMLALAALNRLKLTPLLLALPADPVAVPDPVRRLYRSAMAESSLALLLLLVVGSLVHLTPGAHSAAVWPFPVTLDIHAMTDLPGGRLALLAAAAGGAAGFVAAAMALRRWRWQFAAAGVAAIAALGVFGLGPFVIAAFPTSYAHSPVRYGSLAIAHGQSIYAENCVVCHGPYGYGDGPAAASLPVRPADLTGAHLYHHGEGTLFWWVSHGVPDSAMPGFADQLSETQRWDALAFLRAQADAERAKFMAADTEARGPVVAPDFAFQIGHAPQETLKEQRSRFIVLLVLFGDASARDRLRELDAATPQLERAGVRIIALPMAKDAEALDKPLALAHLTIAETDPETVAAYSLFRRTVSVERVPPMPAHMEFLIDRQGYLRYRWSPEYGTGWSRIAELVKRIDVLNHEKPRPPAPEGHVH
jgi:putative copper export protein/mono/diheme cytochrome c family protein